MVYQTGDFCKKIFSVPLTTSGEHYEQVASRRELHCSAIPFCQKWLIPKREMETWFREHFDLYQRKRAYSNMLMVNYSYYHCESKETLEAQSIFLQSDSSS